LTFSIVAYDAATESWGVAVASKFLAVGALVPWGRAGAGAIATQANANLSFGPRGLDLLSEGLNADEVITQLVASDDGRAHRQLGVVDSRGNAATYTGEECFDWAGGAAGDGFTAQGNILTGPEVVQAMRDEFGVAAPFAQRLFASLHAGDAAGGDRRGRQSAAIRVWREGAAYGGQLDLAIDLRVDDHPAPVTELARLLDLYELYFGKPDPTTLLPLDGSLEQEVFALVARLGHTSLEAWAGVENFEERLVPDKIDPLILEKLRHQAEP